MIKYALVLDEETGLVSAGLGTDAEFYKSQGFTEQDIEQSEIDKQWYLSAKCPHYTEEEKRQERCEQFHREFFNTCLGYVRRKYTNKNGEVKDFLSDALPSLSIAYDSGTVGQVYVYDEPNFDQDVEDWTIYQHKVSIAPEFISDCFTQTNKDFFGI